MPAGLAPERNGRSPAGESAGSVPPGSAMRAARAAFFQERFPEFWATIEDHDYALFEAHVITEGEAAEIRSAAADSWRIYQRTFEVLRAMPDQALRDMGIPKQALEVCRLGYAGVPETVVGRFDLIRTDDGYKVIEFNAETPFFYWETNRISGAVVRNLGYRDPNAESEALVQRALADAVRNTSVPGARVVVTAYNPYREDFFTAQYAREILADALPDREVAFAALHDLRVDDNGLNDSVGRIDVLYRFYPLEHFAHDDGGAALFDLVREGKVALLNPPSALLLQAKSAQVVIWGLADGDAFFTAEERAIIRRRFLPTFADLPPDGHAYVEKPVFGREGNTVRIVRAGDVLYESAKRDYDDQPCVYQRCVALPTVPYVDPRTGPQIGHAIHTCFIAGGRPGALGLRVGSPITDGSARFLPLAYAS